MKQLQCSLISKYPSFVGYAIRFVVATQVDFENYI